MRRHNVLREIGAEMIPWRLLLNKIDRVSEADPAALRAKHPDAILIARRGHQMKHSEELAYSA